MTSMMVILFILSLQRVLSYRNIKRFLNCGIQRGKDKLCPALKLALGKSLNDIKFTCRLSANLKEVLAILTKVKWLEDLSDLINMKS